MAKILSKDEILTVYHLLNKTYPDAFCGLNHKNNFELLIATMLSAQCTDKRVNIVTNDLFKELRTPEDFVKLSQNELKNKIRSCGLSNSKSKNIIKTSKLLIKQFNSKVPNKDKDLLSLPGVGEKTKNVVMAVGFNIPRMPVDTHVFRVSNRIGLVNEKNVSKTQKKLTERFEKKYWIRLHHLLIFHGRNCCKARNPECEECVLNKICLFINNKKNKEE